RKLLLGQYLYYSGLVSWKTLIDSISWQRRQRPIIGQIALDWGILSNDTIQRILTERRCNERFGEYALHNGYITYFEFLAITGKQKSLQRPIGEYFIKQGFIRSQAIEAMTEKLKKHNREIITNDRSFFCY
ncbi:MAG: molecular chaperone DnaJ, partial [Thermodesulfobacteriota bacterium]